MAAGELLRSLGEDTMVVEEDLVRTAMKSFTITAQRTRFAACASYYK
jgi:hypothetical protein